MCWATKMIGTSTRKMSETLRAVAGSKEVAFFSPPLSEGGLRGVVRSGKNLPQPPLGKEGSKKPNGLFSVERH